MAVILTDFRIFRKIITQIGDIFFSQKIVATLYQSKPVISSTPSLNVDQNCRFFIQPVGRASFLSCKTMMRLFPRAGWNWRLQRGLQVDLLGGENYSIIATWVGQHYTTCIVFICSHPPPCETLETIEMVRSSPMWPWPMRMVGRRRHTRWSCLCLIPVFVKLFLDLFRNYSCICFGIIVAFVLKLLFGLRCISSRNNPVVFYRGSYIRCTYFVYTFLMQK